MRISLIVGFCISLILAQGEVVPLSEKVGFVIDAEENKFYNIIPNVKGFESAQFYELGKNRYSAKIAFVEYTHLKSSKRNYSLRDFVELQTKVNMQPYITPEDRIAQRENLTFLHTQETITNIPADQFVTIKHRNGTLIQGTLRSFEDKVITVQTPVSIESIPIWDLKRITYREKIEDRSSWKPVVYTLSALSGILLAEGWNSQTAPQVDYAWHYRFLGATLGLLAGSEAFQVFSVMSSPTSVFALTPDEMDKLKN